MAITKEELEKAMREWFVAWDNNEIKAITVMMDKVGFGYRDAAWRDLTENEYTATLERFFSQMEYFHLELADLQTSVEGEIGLAWGVFIEDFQEKGRPPERARVRFSCTLLKESRGWQTLLFHRDIQPFEADGTYPRELNLPHG